MLAFTVWLGGFAFIPASGAMQFLKYGYAVGETLY